MHRLAAGSAPADQRAAIDRLKLPGDRKLRPALRLQVLDAKDGRFGNHLRAFRLSSSKAAPKFELFATMATQSTSGKRTLRESRRSGKEIRPPKQSGEGEVASRTVAPGAQLR
jgi:hypothetical protein